MQVKNAAVLQAIFTLKRNFAEGARPAKKILSGVEVAPFKDNADAAGCISADFEMGWGWRSRGRDGAQQMGERERRHVPLIVRLLEEYAIPVTWATIGHLFLESCTRSPAGLAHPTMPRPLKDGTWNGDWYWPDPCSNVRDAPAWYGPDLIRQIVDAPASHEIGTHSFSHINFQAQYSSPEVVLGELDACHGLMRPLGLRPRTLIFPRHQAEYAYLPLLADAGVTVVRHRDKKVRLSYPERTSSGVYRIYESMNLRIARHYDYLDKVKLFISKAMERHAAYSLWFHPSDPSEWFDPQLRAILQYMAAERRRGGLWITTMQALAAYCEAREQLQLSVERHENSLNIAINSLFDASRYGATAITLLIPVPFEPKSAWLGLTKGERAPAAVRWARDGSARAMINVPTTAEELHLTF
jgi:peptidoglycan/xylan/chitin deacetylase (PgdA/CDA1 family)